MIASIILCITFNQFHILQVKRTYSHGTYRAGPMRQISLVGAVDEEVGDYFPEFLDMLEDSPFLKVRENIKQSNLWVLLPYYRWYRWLFQNYELFISFELEGKKGRYEKLKVNFIVVCAYDFGTNYNGKAKWCTRK